MSVPIFARPKLPPTQTDIMFPVLNFAGGLNTKASPVLLNTDDYYALRRNQLITLENFDRDESGGLTTRWSYTKLNTVAAIAPATGTAEIRSMYELRQRDGDKYILANAGGEVWKYDGAGGFTSLGSVTTADLAAHWTTALDLAIMVNGTDKPYKFDGATFALLGGGTGTTPSGCSCCIYYQGRLLAFKQLSMYYTANGQPEEWGGTDAGIAAIPARFSSGVTACLAYYDLLLVFLDSEVFQLNGTGPSNWTWTCISSAYGHTLSPNGVSAGGNDVYFGNGDGVHRLSTTLAQDQLGDIEENYASALVEPTWQALTVTNVPYRTMIHAKKKNQIIVLVGNSGIQNNSAMVMDYYHKDPKGNPTWSIYTNFAFSSACEVKSLTTNKLDILFGGYDGFVYKYVDNEQDPGAVNIQGRFQYLTDLGEPAWLKTWRWLVLYCRSQNVNITLNTQFDFGQSLNSQTINLQALGGHRIGVDWMMGVDPLGLANYANKRASIPGHGRYGAFLFTCNVATRVTISGMIIYAGKRRITG